MQDPSLKTSHREDQESLTECQTASFFLALKASTSVKDRCTHPEPCFPATVPISRLQQTSSAITADYQDISLKIVPTRPKFNVDNRHQRQHQIQMEPANNSQVEYNFDDFYEQYEFKNSEKFVTVKNRLK